VTLRYSYGYIANDCDNVSGTLRTASLIDVQPDEAQLADGWLGLAFDQGAILCNQPTWPGTRFYVVAGLSGASSAGISGAEFRLRATPADAYMLAVSPLPGWIAIGNPLGIGTTMAASCQLSAGSSRVPLLELTAFPMAATSAANVFVDAHLTPPNPSLPNPTLVLCDEPSFTARGAGLGYTILLSPNNPVGPCPAIPAVPTQNGSWSQIKDLFR
jgi:hypothetical protein